jgi:hypothetical protein
VARVSTRVAADLRPIYTAVDAATTVHALQAFDAEPAEPYPMTAAPRRKSGNRRCRSSRSRRCQARRLHRQTEHRGAARPGAQDDQPAGGVIGRKCRGELMYLSIINAERRWRKAYI